MGERYFAKFKQCVIMFEMSSTKWLLFSIFCVLFESTLYHYYYFYSPEITSEKCDAKRIEKILHK